MPGLSEILNEVNSGVNSGNAFAVNTVRLKYLKQLSDATGRNTIAYYSCFLDNTDAKNSSIIDLDKNGFMATIHKLDRKKGLDLILHTPGGDLAATESIVDYLRLMFGDDIRAIIPQIAMSAGTMIACSCKSIIMGKQSSLGPVDPQINFIAACGVIEEFNRAKQEVSKDQSCIPIWQTIINKYPPAFIVKCENAIKWSKEMVVSFLLQNMLKNEKDKGKKAKKIVDYLSNHNKTKSHSRHIGVEDCERIGLKIERLEDIRSVDETKNTDIQDIVLSIHHSYMVTFSHLPIIKIIENQLGNNFYLNRTY